MLLQLMNFSSVGAGTWLPFLSSKRQRIAFPECSTLFRMTRESFLLVLSRPTSSRWPYCHALLPLVAVLSRPTSSSGRTVTPYFL
jgi:hypothetical protein